MTKYTELAGGELRIWIEQNQSICLRAVDSFGDPVELSLDEAVELLRTLECLVNELRELEG